MQPFIHRTSLRRFRCRLRRRLRLLRRRRRCVVVVFFPPVSQHFSGLTHRSMTSVRSSHGFPLTYSFKFSHKLAQAIYIYTHIHITYIHTYICIPRRT